MKLWSDATANCHLRGSGERNQEKRRTKVSFGRTMMRALDLQYRSNATSYSFETRYSQLEHSHSTIEGVNTRRGLARNPHSGVRTLEPADSRVTRSCSVKYLFMWVASHNCVWKLLPASDITFHNVKNHKAFYAQRSLLIWFVVCLSLYSLKIFFKIPQAAFHHFFTKNEVMPTIRYAFLWSLWKLRGAPREYPLVSG